MTSKPTPCPNCGRDSFLDLMCADCNRAFGKGQTYEYNKWRAKCKEHSEDGHEFCDKCVEYGRKEERQRIIKWIRNQNPAFGQKMTTLNNENAYLIIESELTELEKGDT
jgi:hypothetical protein